MGELFTRADVAHGDEDDVAAQAEIGVTAMVAVEHGTLTFLFRHRRNKEIIANLNFDWTEPRVDIGQLLATDDASSLDHDHFIPADVGDGEQAAAVNGASA